MRQIQCPECRGEGVIEVDEGAWYVRLDDCPSCGGSGQIDDPEDDGTEVLQTRNATAEDAEMFDAALMKSVKIVHHGAFVSPYLLRPLRTIEQAERDMTK